MGTASTGSEAKANADLVQRIRAASGIGPNEGPSDEQILSAVSGFAGRLNYWYSRVMKEHVGRYRGAIIGRINPYIRRIECDGLTSRQTAERLVRDYTSRNFVTAGGWALEAMALGIGQDVHKSTTEGFDLQRYDRETNTHHLYVMKSGTVTRNSDILKAVRGSQRKAGKLVKQEGAAKLEVTYAVAAGKTTSTYDNNYSRPSSAQFWSEITGLAPNKAVELTLEIAAAAGERAQKGASVHIEALTVLVTDYIESRTDANVVDWDFVAARTMQEKSTWTDEDRLRHKRALKKLESTGYVIEKPSPRGAKAS
jgi:hypothetical protein